MHEETILGKISKKKKWIQIDRASDKAITVLFVLINLTVFTLIGFVLYLHVQEIDEQFNLKNNSKIIYNKTKNFVKNGSNAFTFNDPVAKKALTTPKSTTKTSNSRVTNNQKKKPFNAASPDVYQRPYKFETFVTINQGSSVQRHESFYLTNGINKPTIDTFKFEISENIDIHTTAFTFPHTEKTEITKSRIPKVSNIDYINSTSKIDNENMNDILFEDNLNSSPGNETTEKNQEDYE